MSRTIILSGSNPKINPPKIIRKDTMLTDTQPYDRNHMKEVLDSIITVWYRFPTLRLGQLLANAAKSNDLFNVQDTTLVSGLWGLAQEHADKDTSKT